METRAPINIGTLRWDNLDGFGEPTDTEFGSPVASADAMSADLRGPDPSSCRRERQRGKDSDESASTSIWAPPWWFGVGGRNSATDKRDCANGDDAFAPTRVERRRLGRIATASRALIPLLRHRPAPATNLEECQQDDLVPATGIAVSALISGLIWTILIWTVYWGIVTIIR